MKKRNFMFAGVGFILGAALLFLSLSLAGPGFGQARGQTASREATATPPTNPTLQIAEPTTESPQRNGTIDSEQLRALYDSASPGVVSIYVTQTAMQSQSGAGSGFVFDQNGHIVTNNHVVAEADLIVVDFSNGFQTTAEVIGRDQDSDLAVLKVKEIPETAVPLPLGEMGAVGVGNWVLAIGNPFGLNTSMSLGIISAKGRAIPSGTTPFSIPQAIQLDAAVNPGNSGGPLLNSEGKVIGVNAQIASGGTRTNAGVAFAIPVSIVKQVVPTLIAEGEYEWPWLGISGTSVNLFIQEANDLESQQGAYVVQVVPDSPAAEAGLQGSEETALVSGIEIPVGGDVITEVNGDPIADYNDLLIKITNSSIGATLELTVIRDGEQQNISVELAARPENTGFQE